MMFVYLCLNGTDSGLIISDVVPGPDQDFIFLIPGLSPAFIKYGAG